MAESTHTLKLIIQAVNNADATFRQIGDRVVQLDNTIRGSTGGISQMGTAMSGVANQLGGTLTGAANAFRGSLDPLKISLDQIGMGVSVVQNKVASLTGVFGGLIAAVPIVMGLGVATEFLHKALADASTETQNMMQLSASWKALQRGDAEETEAFADKVRDLSRTSSYASQEVIGAAKTLSGYKSVATEDLLPALQVVIDMAAYTGRGLAEATYIVGYAARGEMQMLREWGFTFSRATQQSKNFKDIMRELSVIVGGQEAAKMQTYEGAVKELAKAFNQTQRAIGHVLEAAVTPALRDLVGFFRELGKSVDKAFKEGKTEEWTNRLRNAFQIVADFVKRMSLGILQFVETGGLDRIVTGFFAVAQAIQTVVGYVGSFIGGLVQLPSAALAAIAGLLGFKVLWSVFKSIVKMFRDMGDVSDWVKSKIKTGVDAKVADIGREKTAVQGLTQAYRELDAQAAKKPTLKATGPASGMPSDWKEGYFDPRTGKPKGVERLPDPVKPEKRLPPWMEGYYNVKTGEQIRPPAPQIPTTKAPAKTPWWKFGGTGTDVAQGIALAGASVGTMAGLATDAEGPLTKISGILGAIATTASFIPHPFARVVSILAGLLSAATPFLGALLGIKAGAEEASKAIEVKPDDGLVAAFHERFEQAQMTGEKISEVERSLRQGIENSTELTGAQKQKQLASLNKAFREILKSAADHQKALAQVGREGAGKFADESEWDYKARLQRLKLYYNELEALQSSAHERERSRIWETAANEEDAQRRLKAFNIATILEKLAMKEQEYQAEAAMRKAEEEKEVAKVAHNADEVSKIRQDYALKDLEAQQKYQSEVQKSLQETEREIQKLYKERLDILSKQADAGRDAAKALDEIASKSRNEFENLSAKVRQASEETKRAIDLLPEQPDKALQVAQAARQAWVALAQDVKGLEKALKDQATWYDEFYRSLAKQKMGPEQQAQSDMQAAMKLKEEALQAYQQKDDKTAQEKIRQARDMMAEVAKSGPESMKAQALGMMGEIKAVDDMVASTMVANAKAMNEQAKGQIETLNKLIQDIWQTKMAENTAALEKLTEALKQAQQQAPQGMPTPKEAGGAPAFSSMTPTVPKESTTEKEKKATKPDVSTPEGRAQVQPLQPEPTAADKAPVTPRPQRADNYWVDENGKVHRGVPSNYTPLPEGGAPVAGVPDAMSGLIDQLSSAVLGSLSRSFSSVADKTKQVADAVKSSVPESGLGEEAQGVFGGFVESMRKLTGDVGKAAEGLPSELQLNITVNGGTATVSWG